MTKITQLERQIERYRAQLVVKANRKGLYENFGQKEIHKLKNSFIDSSTYTPEMNQNRDAIQEFNEWCRNYEGY
jgi:hypothetical protein